jgi:hypothetical protein
MAEKTTPLVCYDSPTGMTNEILSYATAAGFDLLTFGLSFLLFFWAQDKLFSCGRRLADAIGPALGLVLVAVLAGAFAGRDRTSDVSEEGRQEIADRSKSQQDRDAGRTFFYVLFVGALGAYSGRKAHRLTDAESVDELKIALEKDPVFAFRRGIALQLASGLVGREAREGDPCGGKMT